MHSANTGGDAKLYAKYAPHGDEHSSFGGRIRARGEFSKYSRSQSDRGLPF